MNTSDELYLQYQNLIRDAAWRRCRTNPDLEFDELMSIGNETYCLALASWQPEKGAFSTHLSWQLRHQFSLANSRSIKKRKAEAKLETPWASSNNPHRDCAFVEGVESLGGEAKEIVSLILGSSAELCDFTQSSVRVIRSNISRYLRTLGWSWPAINNSLAEIKTMLKGL